ncbi:MAG: hypothetical protein B6D45_07440 [Ignavibacteriales bacterium UTCHB3]|nr:MAG: hypothetical protein B6D45_07440 [Ignavibacteriales bacterium UTCHB3]
MTLTNITVFIAQSAALLILVFAIISFCVYKFKSRNTVPVYNTTKSLRNPVREYQPEYRSITITETPETEPAIDYYEVPVQSYERIAAPKGRLVSFGDPSRFRSSYTGNKQPMVISNGFKASNSKVQMAQNWA